MADLTSRAEFERYFDSFTGSAWRLECQGTYHEPEEREPMRRYLTGQCDDLSWFADWLDWVRDVRSSGRIVGRVRVLTDPLTDYLTFQLGSITRPALAAGEDIRVLPADRFDDLDLPREDFWIFDDAVVGVLHFGAEGVDGVEVITSPPAVTRFIQRRRAAQAASLAFDQWSASAGR